MWTEMLNSSDVRISDSGFGFYDLYNWLSTETNSDLEVV